ncbi:MAG: TetR/AcrR family transcriptional regulator [Saprospiraceae bacterium]|nr:TetR/AcrR family transcriptional regulator [Saprospiraceae bacterium]MDW8230354.1 TetR/AcrR family transcriptional regulator [Saprospiraceae bacterium]
MSIADRKEREKEEMRRNILSAALGLFREKGYDGVSIRNIADAIEYSPATIYLYFRDKNEIFAALQYEAAGVMRDHFLPLLQIENPWERLIDFGRRYMDFGLKYSDLYDLIFIIRAPMEHVENQECWALGMTTHQFFTQTVQTCVDARYFKSTDTEAIAYTLWAYVHGVVALFVRDRMRMYPPEKREELARKSFAMFTKMIEVL